MNSVTASKNKKHPGFKLVIVGSGNVASSLGTAFINYGHQIIGISGRNTSRANLLAKKFNCKKIKIEEVANTNADFIVIAVKDDAIQDVIKQIPNTTGIVIHTSGSTSMECLSKFVNYGVLYPVDTIKSGRKRDFRDVPFCIEANDTKNLNKIKSLAESISSHVVKVNSEERAYLHLAAVFTNNFGNHLFAIAYKLLSENNLPSSLLSRLILSTATDALELGPSKAQTGPAIRQDLKTIRKQKSLLQKDPELQKLYLLLTKHIQSVNNNKG